MRTKKFSQNSEGKQKLVTEYIRHEGQILEAKTDVTEILGKKAENREMKE